MSSTRLLFQRAPLSKPFPVLKTFTQTRTMASSTQWEWLVICPDKPGVLAKRLEVRPKHFEGLQPLLKSGKWKMGGALLNDKPESDNPAEWDFMGSTLVAVAESKKEILDVLEKDIYSTSGVWDMEKVQIYPFKCAFREK